MIIRCLATAKHTLRFTTYREYQQLAIFFIFFEDRLCVPHRFRLRFTPPPYPYEGFFARLACLQGH
uniref:Uncharacterized protein n=1 Tax=Herelleviridae sp. cttEB8 TaxID=2825832 RepID=A0A8S5P7D1_9CAUD|nr:MAG TPA: hypothetical protein [Herelleviridae sp. cttEB8]